MNKWKLLQIWAVFALVWIGAVTWWQWDNLTLKPWTLDWTFSFWGHGPAKTQARATELIVLPPLLLLVAGYIYARMTEQSRG